jgi:protein SCO1/2
VSLFSFGYTWCPDVCPLTLAKMAEVRRTLGPIAEEVGFYFVTVDPERDTPERLGMYTAAFDRSIVGLTGTPAELERARQAFGVAAERREVPGSSIDYVVDHTALLFLVDAAGRVQLVYPHDSAPDAIAMDIARLLETPGAPPPLPTSNADARTAPGGHLVIHRPWARAGVAGSTSAIYMVIENESDQDEILLGATTNAATATELHRSFHADGMMRMEPVEQVVVPGRTSVSLQPGGLHVMLMGLRQDLPEGAEITVTLRFARAGTLTVVVPVRAGAPGSSSQGTSADGQHDRG